jgi:DNA-binding protein YbaB
LLEDKEQLEDYLVVVLNNAPKKAKDINQAELMLLFLRCK